MEKSSSCVTSGFSRRGETPANRSLSSRLVISKPLFSIRSKNIGDKVAVGQENSLIFFTIDKDNKFKLAKEGFAQGLDANVTSVDFSENEK